MSEIKVLSIEELLAQSSQMMTLMSQFETLFGQTTSALNGINDSWSPNLSNNFAGKISAAQKAFSSIVAMLGNGSAAARLAASAYASGSPGAIIGALMGTGNMDLSGLGQWLNDNPDLMQRGADSIVAVMSEMVGMDLSTVQHATQMLVSGDYEGALRLVGEKGIDIVSSIAAGDTSELAVFQELNEATGGKLSLLNYLANFPKVVIKDTLTETMKSGIDAFQKAESGDTVGAMQSLMETGWNASFGGAQKAFCDVLYDTVSNIPGIGEWYVERGAQDGADMVGISMGAVYEAVTGDSEGAEYYSTYYSKNGGIAGGMVNGFRDIVSFIGDKIGEVNWRSLAC